MNIDNCNHTNTEKHQEEKIFLYTTITGNLQLIHLEQIGYFRHNSKSKLWEAVLNNNHNPGTQKKYKLTKDIESASLSYPD